MDLSNCVTDGIATCNNDSRLFMFFMIFPDFVGTSQLLRIKLKVTMKTMHFHIAQTDFFYDNFIRISGTPLNNMCFREYAKIIR